MGTRVRLLSSSVSVPFQPGSMKPAVAWTMSPRRPSEDFPSIRATTSSGSSTHSSVRPRQNSPGWITNPSSGVATTSSVSPFGGPSLRSITAARWLWNTRNVSPRRRSIEAGWTSSGFHGRITIAPSSTRRRIVPSERTDSGTDGNGSGSGRRYGASPAQSGSSLPAGAGGGANLGAWGAGGGAGEPHLGVRGPPPVARHGREPDGEPSGEPSGGPGPLECVVFAAGATSGN